MLEEPPSNVQIILTTDRAEKLLPTIVSRCKIINLAHKVLKEDGEVESLLLNFILDKEKGIFNQKPFNKIDKENVDKLIEQIILFFRKRLSIDSKAANVIKEIIRLKTLVTNNNLNPQLTIDHILIYIMKRYTIN
ncbi:MAG: polymerase III, delta prime subunit protein [Candidatus Roizmanbacteria bacterium GW2011_GWA2_35_8]|uniref:Polymerase III, delta prime subunit protein n=1 Tax=Candidatus Roizmanbacteria bacterium GW2011_GWA2_35_8 TaxID=1618479 RepID=A0A0G0CXV7_9BACT|nr:MAG: polymerase III, delta prime subunit protein [Candidatus Roizmanbacteria bacterium GW2011_GWA2_35_8]